MLPPCVRDRRPSHSQHAPRAQDHARLPREVRARDHATLPREVEGLDISNYANLKHAFEIIVHSYKLQKEALEANRRRWGEERQDMLSREQNLVEALTAVREALDAGMRVLRFPVLCGPLRREASAVTASLLKL
jgi:hypothetical protein